MVSLGCATEVQAPEPAQAAEVVSDEPAEAPKQLRKMPLPEGKWAKKTNAEHYKIFANHEEAIEWFEAWHAKHFADSPIKPLPRTDALYATLEKELATMWAAFTELLPRDTEGLAKAPFIVLTDDPAVNAFAPYDPDLKVLPHAFIVNVGVFTTTNGKATSAQLRGLIAHELGHHVLKHAWPDVHEKVERWYSVDTAVGDGFGWQQKDNAALRTQGHRVIESELQTGGYAITEWHGNPRVGGWLRTTLDGIHDAAAQKASETCYAATIARDDLRSYVATLLDDMGTLQTGPRGVRTKISELSQAYVDKELACTNVETDTLWTVWSKQLGVPESDLRKGTAKEYAALVDEAPSAASAIFALTKRLDDDVIALGGSVAKLRYYSVEEEADDVSINILFRSEMDANGMALFLHDLALTNKAEKSCEAHVNAGEPAYGPLRSAHHSTCWRVWHSRQLVKYLSTPE